MSVAIEDVVHRREQGTLGKIFTSQPFWVTLAVIIICLVMSQLSPVFATPDNFFEVSRYFSFIGIVALGMTAVIITGGIDLSVGSIMGLAGMVTAIVLSQDYPLIMGIGAGLLAALACGFVNGVLIAYAGLSPFVVTLGMLSIARSIAIVLSENKMVYQFGADEKLFFELGGGKLLTDFEIGGQQIGVAYPVIILVVLMILFMIAFKYTTWGRWLYAVGGNEQAARLTGVPVNRMKLSVYLLSSLMAGISAILLVSFLGSAINALGTGYELRVIASSVIGGANLMGGAGGAYGAVIGALLIDLIRNSLLLYGIDSNWYGIFVGLFIILAVMLEKLRGRRSG